MVLHPGMPYFILSFAAALLALLALLHRDRIDRLLRLRVHPSQMGERTRLALGQGAGALAATVLLLGARISGAAGGQRLLVTLGALALYLWLGLVLPRRGQERAKQRQQALRRETPAFTSFVRISLAGNDSPMVLLERYVATPEPKRAAMQELVREAMLRIRAERRRPFATLLEVVRAYECQELGDVVEALAQAEEQGTDPRPVLRAQQTTLEAVLRDEQTRMLKQRNLVLVAMVAVSVAVGVLGNLLYVMLIGAARQNGVF